MNFYPKAWLMAPVAVGVLTLAATDANAQSARDVSLSSSPLIEDSADLAAYPQLAIKHKLYLDGTYVRGATGLVGDSGAGTFVVGNGENAFGILSHSSFGLLTLPGETLGVNTMGTGAQGGELKSLVAGDMPGDLSGTMQWFDLVYAHGTESLDFGARLSFGADIRKNVSLAETGGQGATSTGGGFGFDLIAGATARFGKSHLDAALEFGLLTDGTKTELDNGTGVRTGRTKGSDFGLALGTKVFLNQSDMLDIVGLFSFAMESASHSAFSDDLPVTGDNGTVIGVLPSLLARKQGASVMALSVGAGPRYRVSERATLAADAQIGFSRMSYDPWKDSECVRPVDGNTSCTFQVSPFGTDEDKTIATNLVIPSVRVAGEFHVLKRLTLRTGFSAVHSISSQKLQRNVATAPGEPVTDPNTPPCSAGQCDDKSSSNNTTFAWTGGLGVDFGEFMLDFAVNSELWHNGPNFISGESSPFAGVVTFRYDMGRGVARQHTTGARFEENEAAPAAPAETTEVETSDEGK